MIPDWRVLPFTEVMTDVSAGNQKTPQSEFKQQGDYPIVDQGKQLVAGFADDPARLCDVQLPAIIFGDHTRCFKYVDFPFCMGADGVKVLRPCLDADVKYLFHFLRQAQLVDAGYDRHYKHLKRIEVVLPPLQEQRRIAAILDKAEALCTKRKAAFAKLDGLAQSIFIEMFGDPILNPHGFPLRPLAGVIDPERPITYGILMPGPDVQDGIPYVRVVDMKGGGIDLSGVRRTSTAISDSYKRSLLRTGDLIMSIRGHVGRFAVVPPGLEGANITQDTARLALRGIDPVYLRECLRSVGFQSWMARRTKGAAVQGINLGDVKNMPIPLPSMQDQARFSEMVTSADRTKDAHQAALVRSEALFRSVQHRAFRGEL